MRDLYLLNILRYNQVLKQKNCLLRFVKRNSSKLELNIWSNGLSEHGFYNMLKRKEFCEIKNTDLYNFLFTYVTSDITAKRSLYGPFRDSFEFWIDDKPISMLSSGEKKKFYTIFLISYIHYYYKNEVFPSIQLIATSVSKQGNFNHYLSLERSSSQ